MSIGFTICKGKRYVWVNLEAATQEESNFCPSLRYSCFFSNESCSGKLSQFRWHIRLEGEFGLQQHWRPSFHSIFLRCFKRHSVFIKTAPVGTSRMYARIVIVYARMKACLQCRSSKVKCDLLKPCTVSSWHSCAISDHNDYLLYLIIRLVSSEVVQSSVKKMRTRLLYICSEDRMAECLLGLVSLLQTKETQMQ